MTASGRFSHSEDFYNISSTTVKTRKRVREKFLLPPFTGGFLPCGAKRNGAGGHPAEPGEGGSPHSSRGDKG